MATLTSMNDIVQGARVVAALRGAHVSPAVGLMIAWADDVPAGTGPSILIPRPGSIDIPDGTKTESDAFDIVEIGTDGATVTGGYVGFSDYVSDELSYDAMENATVMLVDQGMAFLMDRVDADLLTVGATAATDSDFTDLAFTQARFLEAQADYLSNLPHPGMVGTALSRAQMRDLKQDVSTNGGGHFGGDTASAELKQLLDLSFGYEGAFHGSAVFSSSNIVQAAGNATGFMAKMGMFGALAYRVWELAGVKYKEEPRNARNEVTVRVRYGVAVSDPANLHGIVSRAA